jgi:hypothetical protein
MNTFLYGPLSTLPKRATPDNRSEGEEEPNRFQTPSHAQLSRKKASDGPIYFPNGVHALIQRVNGKAPPSTTIGRKAPGTNLMFRACDAVPWKTSAQREAERVEAMRRQAEEAEEQKKKKAAEADDDEEEVLCTQEKRKSLSSQLLPSFVAASSQDDDKENAEGCRGISGVKKRENISKNASKVPLKTRVNDADVVALDWKEQKAETAGNEAEEADFVRASLTPPKGGEKKKNGDDKSAGKRCVDARDVSAALILLCRALPSTKV